MHTKWLGAHTIQVWNAFNVEWNCHSVTVSVAAKVSLYKSLGELFILWHKIWDTDTVCKFFEGSVFTFEFLNNEIHNYELFLSSPILTELLKTEITEAKWKWFMNYEFLFVSFSSYGIQIVLTNFL